ncbi:type VI secretion system baseplate subunit TssG [Alkalimarinus coralli]|uniref:type VI secretion system baseplate subunit TssG n=1 Tax=Alkalimarinus coralli TaxID=2935863 RepID=UPI00202B88C9|nr:type VI secretion system baseplate subunit TssG [Alkalimarinus coralli]
MPAELNTCLLSSARSFSFLAYRSFLCNQGIDSASIRFRGTAGLAHPASEVSGAWLNDSNAEARVTIDVSIMGLYGTTSPLPAFYTERILGIDSESALNRGSTGGNPVAKAETEDGVALKQFYDLFNHQAISLFYDAWKKYRLSNCFTKGTCSDAGVTEHLVPDNPFSTALLALWGIEKHRMASFKHLTLSRLMPLAGVLASRCASRSSLNQALSELFPGEDIVVRDFVHRSIGIPADQLNSLGLDNATLGESLVIGERVNDYNGIAVVVTLASSDCIVKWLPGGEQNEAARELISLLLNTPYEYQLIIDAPGGVPSEEGLGVFGSGVGRGDALGISNGALITV